MKQTKATSVASRIIGGLQEFADALDANQPLSEQFTCRLVQLDLRTTDYGPDQVKETRKILNSSQALFARFLGVSVKTVRAWEQGVNAPKEVACRFMDEIRLNPSYYQKRLRESAVLK
jgi:putative transcriptional regulator